jgi:hypothetical protein
MDIARGVVEHIAIRLGGGEAMEQSLTPEKLVSLLGGFPDKPPLDVRVLEVQEYATYQRQLIEYTT